MQTQPYYRLIQNRPFFAISIAAITANLVGITSYYLLFLIPFVLLISFCFDDFWLNRNKAFITLFSITACIVFFVNAHSNIQKYEESICLLSEIDEVVGKVEYKETKNDITKYYLNNCSAKTKNGYVFECSKIILEYDNDKIIIGSTLLISGDLTSFSRAENEGNFDEITYEKYQGYFAKSLSKEIKIVKNKNVSIGEKLYILKIKLQNAYTQFLLNEEPGILTTISLGDKSKLLPEIKKMFQMAGIAHIMAISGLHISIVGGIAFKRLRAKSASYFISAIIAITLVYFYAKMCGMSVSTKRAVCMFFISMLAKVLGDDYDLLTSLSFAAMICLFLEPLSILSTGFIFSFIAMLGIAIVLNPIENRYDMFCQKRWEKTHRKDKGRRWKPNFKEICIKQIISAIVMWLWTIPIVARVYYEISLYVILLNLILLPVLGILLTCALLGGILYVFVFPYCNICALIKLIFSICHLIIYFYEMACDFVLKLPFSRIITGKIPIWSALIYYLLLILFTNSLYKKRKSRGIFGVVFCLSISLVLFYPKSNKYDITMISVGQGDGIYINTKDGVDYVIDGGSSSITNVGDYRILPFLKCMGVRHIDYWIITHPDEDHYSGLIDAMNSNYQIKNIVFAKSVEKNDGYNEIVNLAKEKRIPISYISSGDRITTKNTSLICVFPRTKSNYSGTNENSLVFLYKTKDYSFLLTGDIGKDQESDVLEYLKEEHLNANIYKAAHHGSNNSNSKELLEFISPKITLISAGKNNRYNHPGKEALKIIENASEKIFCTIDYGQISLYYDKGSFRVDTMF